MASRSLGDSTDVEGDIEGTIPTTFTPSVYRAATILLEMRGSAPDQMNATLHRRLRNTRPHTDYFRFLDLPEELRKMVYEELHPNNTFDLTDLVEEKGTFFNVSRTITREILDTIFRSDHEATYTVSHFKLPSSPVLQYPIIHRIVNFTITIPDVQLDYGYVGPHSDFLVTIMVDNRFGRHANLERMARCLSGSSALKRLSLVLEWENASVTLDPNPWATIYAFGRPLSYLASLLQHLPPIQDFQLRGSQCQMPTPQGVQRAFTKFERKMPRCLQERKTTGTSDFEW